MTAWRDKGCAVCRHQWEAGTPPPEIGVNLRLHASLHRCGVCGTLWKQTERFADIVDRDEAASAFPDAVLEVQAT